MHIHISVHKTSPTHLFSITGFLRGAADSISVFIVGCCRCCASYPRNREDEKTLKITPFRCKLPPVPTVVLLTIVSVLPVIIPVSPPLMDLYAPFRRDCMGTFSVRIPLLLLAAFLASKPLFTCCIVSQKLVGRSLSNTSIGSGKFDASKSTSKLASN